MSQEDEEQYRKDLAANGVDVPDDDAADADAEAKAKEEAEAAEKAKADEEAKAKADAEKEFPRPPKNAPVADFIKVNRDRERMEFRAIQEEKKKLAEAFDLQKAKVDAIFKATSK